MDNRSEGATLLMEKPELGRSGWVGEEGAGGRDFKDVHTQNSCSPLRLKYMQTLPGSFRPPSPQMSQMKVKLPARHTFVP